MKPLISFLLLILILFSGCRKTVPEPPDYDYRIPRVLFLTTGDGRGEGTVSDGAIVALQAFNRLGAFVRFENRSILWNGKNLDQYDIIVAPTLYGYHDADRLYSLTYMDDRELTILKNWVKKGGILVSGENFGRNTTDGTDRVTITGELSEKNWVLGTVIGTPLQEIDVKNFRLSATETLAEDFPNPLIMKVSSSGYILLPPRGSAEKMFGDSLEFQVWFKWQNTKTGTVYPAVFSHTYGKGQMVYFTVSRILHPALDGGLSGTLLIEKLYRRIYQLAMGERRYPIYLNPWPGAAQAALILTFDDGGTPEEYKYAFTSLFPYLNHISLFITGHTPAEVVEWCKNQPQIQLENRSLNHSRFRELDYLTTRKEIQLNELEHHTRFTAFRFPYFMNSFWGMLVLEESGYLCDSSIPVDHTRFYGGGIFPYNIPIFRPSGLIKTLNLLEISPLQHDDRYLYGEKATGEKNYPEFRQKRDATR